MMVRFLKSQDLEARHDRYAAIRSARYHRDVCGRHCGGAALAVFKGSVSDDAAGDGSKDASAQGTGARDGATGTGLFGTALNGLEAESTG
ncbi:MAG: hypothetical protein DMG49_15990 [Acidobacteria bacterium]|nr:MAG: hypothetical protein DMG49_15990 [Acidobacteriota bacterium]